MPPTGDILQTLESDGNFTELLQGLRKTGLDHTLQASGPFTVFAPRDSAFALLTTEEAQALASNATLLLSVMQLHVFPSMNFLKEIGEDSSE